MPDDAATTLEPTTLDTLARTPATLGALLDGLATERVSAPNSEGWSPLDVVAHMLSIDEPILVGRVQLMIREDQPPLPNIGEELADISGMRTWPLLRLLDEFAVQRAAHVASLEKLRPAELARTGHHEFAGEISVANAIHHIAYHDLVHVQQICEMLLSPIEQQRGAMRTAFPHTTR
jgi:hypothetical protein